MFDRIPLYGGVLITITDTFIFLFLDKYGKLFRLLVVLPILFLANAKIVRNGIYFSWCTFVSGKKASTRRSVRGFRQYYMVCKFYRIPELRFSGKFSGILIFPHILFKMVQSMVIWVSFPICKILLKAELKKNALQLQCRHPGPHLQLQLCSAKIWQIIPLPPCSVRIWSCFSIPCCGQQFLDPLSFTKWFTTFPPSHSAFFKKFWFWPSCLRQFLKCSETSINDLSDLS